MKILLQTKRHLNNSETVKNNENLVSDVLELVLYILVESTAKLENSQLFAGTLSNNLRGV